MIPWLLLMLFLITPSDAFTTFGPNCSLPIEAVEYVSSSNIRGTIDIWIKCLLTVLACTWTVQHLNIPRQDRYTHRGTSRFADWDIRGVARGIKWMVITAFAPEVLLGKAWSDYRKGSKDNVDLAILALEDKVPWTLSHTLLANMGGFTIRSETRNGQESLSGSSPLPPGEFESLSPRFHYPRRPASSKTSYMRAGDLIALRRKRILPRLPFITKEDISDRSKDDYLVRSIAIIRSLHAIFCLVLRLARGIPVSQIEVAVVGFVCCAIIIWGLSWNKPYNSRVPFTIISYPGELPADVSQLLSRDDDRSWQESTRGLLRELGITWFQIASPGLNHLSNSKRQHFRRRVQRHGWRRFRKCYTRRSTPDCLEHSLC
ncbi:hypothetical protein BJ875DRAFT_150600 [Amylocarpus encephaloides]|uniref:Uncharacterized protein n=1 Tax=Amylocarpus encephaloides TaxID=45428 RepID=A0A9P7YBF3_9HELO|nr:hypothetical protein BJ875DRAFT_150600 [Amylocarpus encephaloides]